MGFYKRIKEKQRALEIKKELVDAQVFYDLSDAELIALWDKYQSIINKLNKEHVYVGLFNLWNASGIIKDTFNALQEDIGKELKESPRLMQIATIHSAYNTLFEMLCVYHLDDLVYYIASDEMGQKVMDEYKNNIAMIAVYAGRPDIAIECLGKGFVDPLHQNAFQENLAHIAVKESASNRDELLAYCALCERMLGQKDECGRTVLRSQAEWICNESSDSYYETFKAMLGDKKLRQASTVDDKTIWDFIENKSSIDMSRLGDLSKLKEEDMILEK